MPAMNLWKGRILDAKAPFGYPYPFGCLASDFFGLQTVSTDLQSKERDILAIHTKVHCCSGKFRNLHMCSFVLKIGKVFQLIQALLQG